MDIIQAVILGIVQGLTEFLPVSSSGHLVVFQKVLGVEYHDVAFDIAVHVGTTLSVLTIYFKSLKKVLIDSVKTATTRRVTPGFRLALLIVVGSLPTALIGLTLKDHFKSMFHSLFPVGIAFMVTGLLLFFTRNIGSSKKLDLHNWDRHVEKIGAMRAAVIGVFQGLAITPGISRSGATIAAGLYLGVERNTAAMFSFMLAVPAVMGAAVLEFDPVMFSDPHTLTRFLVGMLSSYISGLLGLYGVLHFVKVGRLEYFSYYLWVLGTGSLVYHFAV